MLNTRFMAMILGTAALGCSLNTGRKDACTVAGDCLDGLSCVNHRCSPAGDPPDAGEPSDMDGIMDASPHQYGTIEPITPHSTGLAVANYDTLLGTTGVSGNLGCALLGDESSAPGGEASLVYAKVNREGSDRRCPDGTFAIQNDPNACQLDVYSQLRPGCAVYKRWDASGALVALRLAIGGYVTVQNLDRDGSNHECSVELSVSFAGGTLIQSSFRFAYNVFESYESFCLH